MKEQFIGEACWEGNKASFFSVLNLGYLFHISMRLLLISWQTPQKLFPAELPAPFVPTSDLQRAADESEQEHASPSQSRWWTWEHESPFPLSAPTLPAQPRLGTWHRGEKLRSGGKGWFPAPELSHGVKPPDWTAAQAVCFILQHWDSPSRDTEPRPRDLQGPFNTIHSPPHLKTTAPDPQ